MVNHTPLMYKKCEKTFEILRSEITFLMDLYKIEGSGSGFNRKLGLAETD